MRTFCLLLILTNALYFIWSQLIDVRVNSLERAQAAMVEPPPRIVLAREVQSITEREAPEGEEIRDIEPPTVEPVASPRKLPAQLARANELSCTSIGPIADLSQAAQAQAALRTAGFEPRQRLEQGELWIGYWVSVQNLGTREAAQEAIKTLAENGITDVYLMPGTEPANILSLGVFSDYQRAVRRMDEVRRLGLAPQIDDRKRAGSVYWIDIDLHEPGQIIDSSIFESVPGKIMRLEMRACPAAAAGG